MSEKKARQTLSDLEKGLKKILTQGSRRGATLRPLITELRKLSPLFVSSTPASQAQKKKDETDGEKKPHVTRGAPCKAVLAKKKGYAQAGSNHIRSLEGRGVYNVFTHLTQFLAKEPDILAEMIAYCSFPGEHKPNFDPGCKIGSKKAGQKYPYPWEAHHMLPGSAFYYEKAPGQPCFTAEQYEILIQSEYDINEGTNVIMLPDKEDHTVFIHALLAHPSDHQNYTALVMDGMNDISTKISELEKSAKPHDEIVASFVKELKDLENRCWKLLVKLSRAIVLARMQKIALEGDISKGLRLI
jgi:hypothetical protein